MDKAEHGAALKAAMGRHRLSRERVADHVNVRVRTITNWTSGATMPTPAERALLRELLGPYDDDGDPVETAIRNSPLETHRATRVIAVYQGELYEQRQQERGTG